MAEILYRLSIAIVPVARCGNTVLWELLCHPLCFCGGFPLASSQSPTQLFSWFLPPNRMSERTGREKMRKPVSHDKDRSVSEGKGKKTTSDTNTTIHQLQKQTSAQTFSGWWLPWKWKDKILLLLLLSQSYCWVWHCTMDCSICAIRLNISGVKSIVLLHPSYWTGSGKKRKPWSCASTAQQQAEGWHVIHTALVLLNSTMQAAMKEVTSTPARPSTGHLEFWHQLR